MVLNEREAATPKATPVSGLLNTAGKITKFVFLALSFLNFTLSNCSCTCASEIFVRNKKIHIKPKMNFMSIDFLIILDYICLIKHEIKKKTEQDL